MMPTFVNLKRKVRRITIRLYTSISVHRRIWKGCACPPPKWPKWTKIENVIIDLRTRLASANLTFFSAIILHILLFSALIAFLSTPGASKTALTSASW